MRISIQSPSFELTESLERRIRRRLSGLGERYSASVVSADIFLQDVNGPKGGRDKLLRIHVALRDRQNIVVETVDTDMYSAIDIGARRVHRSLRRHSQKSRRFDRLQLREVRRNLILA